MYSYGYDDYSDCSDEYGYGDPYGYKYAFRDSDSDSDDYFKLPREPPRKGRKLLILIKRKNLKGLKKYIEQGHPTCYITGYFVVPIHRAIRLRNLDIFKILVEAPDFNVNVKDTRGRTPFMRIFAQPKVTPVLEQMLEILMQQPNIDVHVKDRELKTALHYAAGSGNLTWVKKLVDLGLDIHLEDENKMTPLDAALEVGLKVAVEADLQAASKASLQTAMEEAEDPERKASMKIGLKNIKWTPLNPDVINYLLSKGADVWHPDINGNYPLDLVIKSWDLCNIILLSIPEERRAEYVSKKRKAPLLLTALENGNCNLALELLNLGLRFEDISGQNERSLAKKLSFIDVVEKGKVAELLLERIDLEPIMNKNIRVQSWAVYGSLPFGCGPVQLTTLWIFTRRFKSFYMRTYPVFILKQCDYDVQTEHTKLYRLWTVLSEALSYEPGLYELKNEYLRFLLSQPDIVVSEKSSHVSQEVMPPLIAAGLPTGSKLSGFEESLDLLVEFKATVRTRHCFTLFSSKWERKDFEDLIKPYFTKGIFYLEDLFEDDMVMLFRTLKLYPSSISKHDKFLNFLLTKRLQHSRINISRLRELRKFLIGKDYHISIETIQKAIKSYAVRPLLGMARLALKKHFGFFEEEITKYLLELDTPESMIEYVIKGSFESTKLFS